jgi:hypothetical protein
VPAISLILLAEMALSRWAHPFRWAAIALFIFFCARYNAFSQLTRNQFDMAKLSEEAVRTNALWVVGTSCTEDPRVSQAVFQRRMLGCGVTIDLAHAVRDLSEKDSGSILIADHRFDPLLYMQPTLEQHPDWKTDLLAATAPTGSTELSGIINGGNGFFLRRLTKPRAISQSCEVRFGSGWYSLEASSQTNWRRWASDRAELSIETPQAAHIRIEGGLDTIPRPNIVTLRIPGQPDRQIGTPGRFSFEVQAAAGSTLLEMISKAPAVQPYPDTRKIAFGAVNFTVTKVGNSPACALVQGK